MAKRNNDWEIKGRPIAVGRQYDWVAEVQVHFSGAASRIGGLLGLRFFHTDTMTAWRSHKDLCNDLHLSHDRVQKATRDLINRGYLSAKRDFGRPYRYRLTLPPAAQTLEMEASPYTASAPDMSAPYTADMPVMDEPYTAQTTAMMGDDEPPYPAGMQDHTRRGQRMNSFQNSFQGAGLQPDPLMDLQLSNPEAARETDPFASDLDPDARRFYQHLSEDDRAHYRSLSDDDRVGYQHFREGMDDD